jgi:hypothetical protein
VAVIGIGRGQSQLGEDAGHVLRDRSIADHESHGDGGVGAALSHELEDCPLARRNRLERPAVRLAHEQLTDHFGFQDHASAGHPGRGFGECFEILDAIFEQVAHAAAAIRQELDVQRNADSVVPADDRDRAPDGARLAGPRSAGTGTVLGS